MIEPTELQKEHGSFLGFDDDEIIKFVSLSNKRDERGDGWNELFDSANLNGRINLPLASGQVVGLNERLESILEKYNANLSADGLKVKPHPDNHKLLQQYKDDKLLNRDMKLISFLNSLDNADALLLSHDLQVEWGLEANGIDAVEDSNTGALADFELLKNNERISADNYDPESLQVVISRDPIDIAAMSTGRRWQSCTGKLAVDGSVGENYYTVNREIESGTLVAYLAHKHDDKLQYPLMRVLLKPFINENGETILVPNNVYGSESKGNSLMEGHFLHTVRGFVGINVNHGKTGEFTLERGVYSDGQETSLSFGIIQKDHNLAVNIANSISGKIKEYIVEIESAHRAGRTGTAAKYTKKLKNLYGKPNVAALDYLRNLRSMGIGQDLPAPSQVEEAMQSGEVRAKLAEHDFEAQLYLRREDFEQYINESYTNKDSLSLRKKNIGPIAARSLAKIDNIESLDISVNKLEVLGAKELAANDSFLTLDISWNQIVDGGAKALAGNTTLKSLTAKYNQIKDEGAQALAANTSLISLNIDNNLVGEIGAKAFAANTGLKSLRLTENHIGDAGACALAKNTNITSMALGYNKIGPLGAKALAGNTTIRSLDMNDNYIGDAGVKALAGNSSLCSLSLEHCKFGIEGIEALAKNRSLVSLSVKRNKIDIDGVKALVSGLSHNKNLLIYKAYEHDGLLEAHCQQNREVAEDLLKKIINKKPLSPEDKQEVSQRANAITHLLQEDKSLTDDVKQQLSNAIVGERDWVGRSASISKNNSWSAAI